MPLEGINVTNEYILFDNGICFDCRTHKGCGVYLGFFGKNCLTVQKLFCVFNVFFPVNLIFLKKNIIITKKYKIKLADKVWKAKV
jgi:hypothetical protein